MRPAHDKWTNRLATHLESLGIDRVGFQSRTWNALAESYPCLLGDEACAAVWTLDEDVVAYLSTKCGPVLGPCWTAGIVHSRACRVKRSRA